MRKVLVAALALLPACAGGRARDAVPVEGPLGEAFAAYRAGQFEAAEGILARHPGAGPASERALLGGLLLASRGRHAEAIAALERALAEERLAPERAAAIHFEAARVAFDGGEFRAAAYHARAAGKDPEGDPMLRFVEAFAEAPYRVLAGASGEVPIRLEPFAEIAVGVGGGIEARCVVDTAASVCVLARSVARRAGIAPVAEAEEVLDLFGGRTLASFARVPELSIGEARLADVPVLLVDDERLGFPLSDLLSVVRAEGALGLGLLRRFRTSLDFGKGTARLDPVSEEPIPGAVDARIVGGGLLVSAGANGLGGLPFLLDTGTNRSSLTALGAQALGERVRLAAAPGSGSAVGGRVAFLRRALGVRFELARWTVDPLDVPVVGRGDEGGIERAGILGLDVLRAFRVVLEPAAGRIAVERAEPPR